MKSATIMLITPLCWAATFMTFVGFGLCTRGVGMLKWTTNTMQSIKQ